MEHSPAAQAVSGEQQSVVVQAMWIVTFAALTSVGAQIEIPHIPVPYTLQTFFVLLAGAFLGKRNGAASQLLYLLGGALGLPIFSQAGFGLAKLLGPTGGYLLSFPVAAFAVGYLIRQNRSFLWSVVCMLTGLFIVFSLGTLQLNLVYVHHWSEAIASGFLIFSWWDGVKLIVASVVYQQLSKRYRD